MTDKLLTEHHLEFLSFKGDCIGSSESTLVKIPHFWKSHVAVNIFFIIILLPMIQEGLLSVLQANVCAMRIG